MLRGIIQIPRPMMTTLMTHTAMAGSNIFPGNRKIAPLLTNGTIDVHST